MEKIIDGVDLTKVYDVLEEYAVEFEKQLKERYELNDRKASGKLIESISIDFLTPDDSHISVVLNIEDWYYWVENGRKPTSAGKHCPIAPILTWVRNKQIIPRPTKQGKLPTQEQFAYAVRQKMDKEVVGGYDGSHDIQYTQQSLESKYRELLNKALKEAVSEYVITFIDKFVKEQLP